MAAAAVQIEEAHRRPQHAVVPRREFEQLLVSADGHVEDGEEATARRVPGDRRVAEVALERGQQRAQVAPVERDLLPVRGAQAVSARHEKAADDGLRDRRGIDGDHALDRRKLVSEHAAMAGGADDGLIRDQEAQLSDQRLLAA